LQDKALDGRLRRVERVVGILTEEIRYCNRLLRSLRQLLDQAERHHYLPFARPALDPWQTDVVAILPVEVLRVMQNAVKRSVEQLVLVLLQLILDHQAVWTAQGAQAGAIDLVVAVTYTTS
jgi:hypothetical protein